MQRTLISLCTLVSALAGWLLGGNRHTPEKVAVPIVNIATPQPVEKPIVGAEPKTLDVKDIVAHIVAEFGEQHQSEEVSVRLFAELQDLKNEDFGGAVTALISLKDWHVSEATRLLVGYWAERDLPAVRQWVLGLRSSPWISNLTEAVFNTWGRSDFAGMCDWLEVHAGDLSSKVHREAAGFSLAKAAGRENPERGLRLLGIVEPEGAPHSWNLYHEWAAIEPMGAAKRAMREPDEKVRGRAINAIASEWGQRDPAAARTWAERIPDPILSRNTVVYIGSALGWSDPRAGADYLAQIPQSNEARDALRGTVSAWAERDLDSAFGWAADLADAHLGDWVAGEVKAKAPSEQQGKMEQRWRELRSTKQPNSGPAR
jgi:hypothetical protein